VCFRLAELFLKQTSPAVTAGTCDSYSLFFDMNTLFEEFMGRIATRIFSSPNTRVIRQGPREYLACAEWSRPAWAFGMKPDVVAMHSGKALWALDSKWKTLSPQEARDGVSQDDMYQMYAYASCYGCTDVILLYPHHRELTREPGTRVTYSLNPWLAEAQSAAARRVSVATVDLADIGSVASQLKRIVGAVQARAKHSASMQPHAGAIAIFDNGPQ
jgi:5-methylcytosine-specific restriction enzyme subunit McrC